MPDYALAIEQFPRLRQSRLAAFDRCALSNFFEEKYGAGWSTHPQASGQIFHRVAAKILTTLHKQGERTMPTSEAIAILDETLRQTDIDKRCPDCSAPVVERFQGEMGPRIRCANGHDHSSEFVNLPFSEVKDLRWMVVKFANDNAWDIDGLVDVEQRLQATITYKDDEGNAIERVLTGALDALFVVGAEDEIGIVLDFKSGWGIPGPTELGFDGYFQQRFYGWLVFRNYPSIQQITLREHYPRHSDTREATVFRSDMGDVEAELSALVQRYDMAWSEGIFPPTPGHHCQFCPRAGACPIFPGVRAEGMVTDPETAERVARELTVAERVIATRKEALSAYTSVHGPQEVSSHKGRRGWLHKSSKRTSRPTKTEMERAISLARQGVPLDLDRLYQTAAVSRFGLHPISEVPDSADDAALMSALEESVERHRM